MKKREKQFYSENLLLSVTGHLLVVALMVTSVVIFTTNRSDVIAPDRVQIMEIDLSNVKITGDETKLYNTDVPKVEDKKVEEPKEEPKPEPKPEPVAAEKDTKSDEFVDENTTKKPEKPAEKPKEEPKADQPAPKKKTVVRVNREVLSLDRTLTVSVVDALRVAMTRCWIIDTTRPDLNDIRAVAHLKLRPNGTVADVWFESATRAETDPVFAYVLDTIRAAIHTCEPLSMLPRAEYNKWKDIQLTFYPMSQRVM